MAKSGGYIASDDLTRYRTIDREALRGTYRGYEIVGPPPPSSGPLHIIQMLNILEGYDIGALGFGSADTLHLVAEALKIAFADRAAATADPAFVTVPVARLVDKGTPPSGARASTPPACSVGPPASPRASHRTRRISPSPTTRATSSPARRPSTASSARGLS